MASHFRWKFREKLFLLLADAIIYFAIVLVLFRVLVSQEQVEALLSSIGFFFIFLNLLVWNYIFGNYELEVVRNFIKTFQKTLFVVLTTLVIAVFVNYLGGKERAGVFGRGVLAGSLLIFWVYVHISRWWLAARWTSSNQTSRWVFIADSATQEKVLKDLKLARLPFSIVWYEKAGAAELLEDSSLLGIIFSIRDRDPGLIDILMNVRLKGLPVYDLIDFYEANFRKMPIFFLSPEFFSFSKGFNLLGNPFLQRMKRLSDIFISLVILVPALPVMALLFILIRLESAGPALYSQKRGGKDERVFTLYKFRSMRTDAESGGAQWARVNDDRVTRLGRLLRKTRLDELPQLWNILKGDMSFVGPRPERPEFNLQLEKEIPFYQLRHLVRPGLTGWAQINYPYGASIEDAFQKLQYDLYYVKNFSLILDFQVILKTIRVILLGQGR